MKGGTKHGNTLLARRQVAAAKQNVTLDHLIQLEADLTVRGTTKGQFLGRLLEMERSGSCMHQCSSFEDLQVGLEVKRTSVRLVRPKIQLTKCSSHSLTAHPINCMSSIFSPSPSRVGPLAYLGATDMMTRFSMRGGCDGRTPSSMFLKYDAYRRWDGIVSSSGVTFLHLAQYSSA